MGMSGDFARAVQFGATYVRVGTAIFGERASYGVMTIRVRRFTCASSISRSCRVSAMQPAVGA